MSQAASADAIRHHYDVGTEFYALWLDPSLTYSAACFEPGTRPGPEDDARLPAAQLRKLDLAAERSAAPGKPRVLDIGCGWGGGLFRLVDQHRVQHATGLTLSLDQARHIQAKGHAQVTVAVEGFDTHRPATPYDAAICIGAFEHFARPQLPPEDKLACYRAFFEHSYRLLAPGAQLYLQTIAYGDAQASAAPTFLQQYVFPESDLPRLWEIMRAADGLFEVVSLDNHCEHYERTVKCWDRALRRHEREAVALTSADVVRRYRQYLRLAAIAFHQHTFVLYRIGLRRLGK